MSGPKPSFEGCLEALLHYHGLVLDHVHYQTLSEVWHVSSSVLSSQSASTPVARSMIEDQTLTAMDLRLRHGLISRLRVRAILALFFKACTTPAEGNLIFLIPETLQNIMLRTDHMMRMSLERDGLIQSFSHFQALKEFSLNRSLHADTEQLGHDPISCKEAHPNLNSGWLRRNPYAFDYIARPCRFIEWHADGKSVNKCPQDALCDSCHTVEEYQYHPDAYKKRPCPRGFQCQSMETCPSFHQTLQEQATAAETAAETVRRFEQTSSTIATTPAMSRGSFAPSLSLPVPAALSRQGAAASGGGGASSMIPSSSPTLSQRSPLSSDSRSPPQLRDARSFAAAAAAAAAAVAAATTTTGGHQLPPHHHHPYARSASSPRHHQPHNQSRSRRRYPSPPPHSPPPRHHHRNLRKPGLPRLMSEFRKYGMDILTPPSMMDIVLKIIYDFFQENIQKPLTHREITYRLFYRLTGMSIPGIEAVSRTKLRGVLALLKTVGCFVCSKDSHEESLTTMAVRPELDTLTKFRELYDLGLLAYASYASISLGPEDLEMLLSESTRQQMTIDSLPPAYWPVVMNEFEQRLSPTEPFWKTIHDPSKSASPTSASSSGRSGRRRRGKGGRGEGGGEDEEGDEEEGSSPGSAESSGASSHESEKSSASGGSKKGPHSAAAVEALAKKGKSSFSVALDRSLRTYERSAEIEAQEEEAQTAEYEKEIVPMLERMSSQEEREGFRGLLESSITSGARVTTSITRSLLGLPVRPTASAAPTIPATPTTARAGAATSTTTATTSATPFTTGAVSATATSTTTPAPSPTMFIPPMSLTTSISSISSRSGGAMEEEEEEAVGRRETGEMAEGRGGQVDVQSKEEEEEDDDQGLHLDSSPSPEVAHPPPSQQPEQPPSRSFQPPGIVCYHRLPGSNINIGAFLLGFVSLLRMEEQQQVVVVTTGDGGDEAKDEENDDSDQEEKEGQGEGGRGEVQGMKKETMAEREGQGRSKTAAGGGGKGVQEKAQ